MRRIMCFGDSNTHGYDPDGPTRYEHNVRWTGRLQKALGDDYAVIEAGLNGLTSGFDDPDKPNRNGKRAIGYFLHANKPLDLITVMVGTNDTKVKFHADLDGIGGNIEKLLWSIINHEQTEQNNTKILLISPVPMDKSAAVDEMNMSSVFMTHWFAETLRKRARKVGVYFADAADWGIELTPDGCHFSAEGHRIFALKIEEEIRKIL